MGIDVLLATTDPAKNLSIFDPASPQTESIRSLSIFVLVISLLIFLIVEGVLVYAFLRFRRRREGEIKGNAEKTEPAQVYGSMPIEIAWTAAPALIVFIFVLVTARTLWEVEVDPPDPKAGDNALFVSVIGRQWWWEYQYEYYDGRKLQIITANELHVPASTEEITRPVYLKIKSADVIHSFWVPRLAGKMDAIPGRTNHLWFQTQRPGLYLGQCAEYCGTQHAKMLLRVYVDPAEEFDTWLRNQEEKAKVVANPDVEKGRKFFLSQSCINCHRIYGTKKAKGSYAPDLTHLMSRETIASGTLKNNRVNLKSWIRDPQGLKQGCLMPAFDFSNRELDVLVEYLDSLK